MNEVQYESEILAGAIYHVAMHDSDDELTMKQAGTILAAGMKEHHSNVEYRVTVHKIQKDGGKVYKVLCARPKD
ncbi:hypothetical protein [Maritalea porphyrae]|uniref:hypothetical protein n=1 Tax=Maritalea porphyrae TaxID=880732 RepID=UPI0022B0193B|nr:hypothetical protein [Maritalea porphyrae]MCZ4270900.1 hypothetical protein [Maritalea porphyrae]